MKNYQLLAKLTYLKLIGYFNGEYIWQGTDSQIRLAMLDEELRSISL